MNQLKHFITSTAERFLNITSLLILITIICGVPISLSAGAISQGEHLFIQHCSGCHINGGNIIRRGKTLKLKDLKRRELDNPKAIARVARIGIGTMSGYENILRQGDDEIIADWIWEQAQNAWIQG